MLNLNKTKIRGISLVLVLVMVLAMCLTGCKDQEARDEAKKAADAVADKVSKADVDKAVSEALKDYATKADIPDLTLEKVKTEITNALSDYLKKSDGVTTADVESAVANALKDYAKKSELLTEAKVNELINAAKVDLGQQITSQAGTTLSTAKAEAEKKIDKEAWKLVTDSVVDKCLEIDAKEKAQEANKSNYTAENWAKVESVYYAAKIRLYRAYDAADLASIVADVDEKIKAIPTAASEAVAVEELISKISFPATTADFDAVKAAREAYDKWAADYSVTDFAGAQAKGISLGILEYAEEKIDAKEVEYKAIDAEIKEFIHQNTVTDFQKDGKDKDGKDIKVDKTDAEIREEALAASNKILASALEKLEPIYDKYVKFVGKKTEFSAEELAEIKTLDKDAVKAKDTKYDNNGVEKNLDEFVVFYYPVLEKYIDAAYADQYNVLKTEAIKNTLAKMAEINLADDTFKAEVTKLGSQFAEVMEAELQWKNACYHVANNVTEYPGDNFTAKFEYAKEHLRLVNEAVKAIDDVDGFYFYLEEVAKQKTAADREKFVAEKYAYDFVKQVIIDCYNKVNAVSVANDKYELYKLNAINAIAELTKTYIDGRAKTQRAKDAAKNLVLEYIPTIRSMTFRDSALGYKYNNKGDVADKEAKEHLENTLVDAFEALLNAIPEEEGKVAEYEAANMAADAVKKVICDSCETAIANVANPVETPVEPTNPDAPVEGGEEVQG